MNIKEIINTYYELHYDEYKTKTRETHRYIIKKLYLFLDHVNIYDTNDIDNTFSLKLVKFCKSTLLMRHRYINRVISYFKNVLLFNEIMTPFHKAKLLKNDSVPFERFYDYELTKIFKYINQMDYTANSLVYKTMVYLLLDSGMRQGEMLSVKISNIDFSSTPYKIYILSNKTNKPRFVPFSDFSHDHIKQLVELNPNRKYLFHNFLKDRPLVKNDVKLFYRRLAEWTDIDRIHTHRFRKTFASRLAENGMNLIDIQHLLDHSRVSTTIIYTIINKQRYLSEYNKFNNWFEKEKRA